MTGSNNLTSARAVMPKRDNGRRRVAALLDAAAAVIAEKGFEAATMAEIAARADARIGSLYRFFPNKDAIADALTDHYASVLDAEFASVIAIAATSSPDALADMLGALLVKLRPRTRALTALLDSIRDLTDVRIRFRAQTLAGVRATLLAYAPDLQDRLADDMAAAVLTIMKALAAMIVENAPSTPGAPDEMRHMLRLYLRARLGTSAS